MKKKMSAEAQAVLDQVHADVDQAMSRAGFQLEHAGQDMGALRKKMIAARLAVLAEASRA